MRNNIIPESRLFLLKDVPLTPDYEYTLDFNDVGDQSAYMGAKIDTRLDEMQYSYIRTDDTINIELPIEETEGINYLSFYNNGKVYYAFIERKEYVNPKCTKLYFKIDVFQTFMFDYELQESFVDREHQDRLQHVTGNTFQRLYNLQPENLEIGEEYRGQGRYLIDTPLPIFEEQSKGIYIIKTSKPLGLIYNEETGNFNKDLTKTTLQGGISSNIFVYALPSWECQMGIIDSNGIEYVMPQISKSYNELLKDISSLSSVLSISFIKYSELPISYSKYQDTEQFILWFDNRKGISKALPAIVKRDTAIDIQYIFFLSELGDTYELEIENDFFIDINNLSIENAPSQHFESKLYTYPYYFYRINIDTSMLQIRQENSMGRTFNINVVTSYNPQGTRTAIPYNYNNFNYDYNVQKDIDNKCELTLTTDKWLDYVMNNQASMNGGILTSAGMFAGNLALGILTGGIGLAVAGGQAIGMIGQIANEMQKRRDIKNQPNDVRPSQFDIMINHSLNQSKWFYEKVSIKDEFRNNIFSYFNHFGYKCNTFKKPDTRSRYYFNYIKTIGVKIKSGIDRRWETELKSIYDNGVTIWHWRNENTFKGVNNYNYENVEMALIGGSNGN